MLDVWQNNLIGCKMEEIHAQLKRRDPRKEAGERESEEAEEQKASGGLSK
jgi:hypothetical protein